VRRFVENFASAQPPPSPSFESPKNFPPSSIMFIPWQVGAQFLLRTGKWAWGRETSLFHWDNSKFQLRGHFIAPLPIGNKNIQFKESSLRHQVPIFILAPLTISARFIRKAAAKFPTFLLCDLKANFNGSQRMGKGQRTYLSKNFRTSPLIKIYRRRSLSARAISTDSIFLTLKKGKNYANKLQKGRLCILECMSKTGLGKICLIVWI
jgi:hypothetical protein